MPSETFTTPGVWHRFVIPDGVTEVGVDVKGAGNGINRGGRVAGIMSVNPGAVYHVFVGGQGEWPNGRQSGAGGAGGGGWGGTGRGDGQGGAGGGGASAIAVGGPPGWIRVVAGGAGGRSGDNANNGGAGGADQGERGGRGLVGTGGTVAPTGGSQSEPGVGGKNQSAKPTYDGENASGVAIGTGGRGGQVPDGNSHGGGGGGGGWYGGGGGNAGGSGSPATGGAGGSNYHGGLAKVLAHERGTGNDTNGSVVIEWVSRFGDGTGDIEKDSHPPPPGDLKIDGEDLGTDTTTRAMSGVRLSGTLANPNAAERTQMVVRVVPADNDDTTEEWNFNNGFMTYTSEWVGNVADGGDPFLVEVAVNGLQPNQKYYVRAYSLDSNGKWSIGMGDDPAEGGWAGGSFWTNRPPTPPDIIAPSDNAHFDVADNIFMAWTPRDPDDDDAQSAAEIRVRRLSRPGESVVSDWSLLASIPGPTASLTTLAAHFTGNQFYVWQVRTSDSNHVWSDWSPVRSFFVESGTTPPVIASPRRGEAVIAQDTAVFRWQYLDPTTSAQQTNADVRVRVVGTQDWITHFGDGVQPLGTPEWVFPLDTFIEGYHYEWQVRTYTGSMVSAWSTAEDFWATAKPGQGLNVRAVMPQYESVAPPLGCGNNRVFIFDRGGSVMRGEITPATLIRYGRLRDDISSCTIFVNGFGKDCGALLSELRCWMHEIVVFRDGKRVWEGPVTRITAEPGQVEIEAKDVMGYLYRRIMRQGYNDTYREINGVKYGGLSVVRRAALTTMNAMAYDDPNVLRWMTEIAHSDDAIQHRAVPDYAKMAWEEVDDLAANAGLDYTVVGRRIVYWDTHRALGRLPEMRDEHFSQPVHVTEYGMQLANHFGVTNNAGVYGVAERGMTNLPNDPYYLPDTLLPDPDYASRGTPLYYGWVEQLVSAYGETEGDEGTALTEAARASLQQTLAEQAERGIAPRWPTPVVVRVPDNATINPDVNLGFDQLVPGVWIPVRAHGTIREISQWQKLDAVQVEQTADGGERIMVTMSPAPNGGSDPDADAAAVEAAG